MYEAMRHRAPFFTRAAGLTVAADGSAERLRGPTVFVWSLETTRR